MKSDVSIKPEASFGMRILPNHILLFEAAGTSRMEQDKITCKNHRQYNKSL